MEEQDYLIALNMVQGLGTKGVFRLLRHFSRPSRIFKASLREICEGGHISALLAERISAVIHSNELTQEREQIRDLKVQVITLFDKEYPFLLAQIYDPPPVLYVWGDSSLLKSTAVAVVGCRRASFYGLQQAERIARALSRRRICIVSGLARGIDTAAHKGALSCQGSTIAVLGCGLTHVYPPENRALFKKITCQGTVVSEFPLKVTPRREYFPRRNRIISGLSRAVVVVEAARRSGSLITADLALNQGREVFAVPGAANSVNAQGTNKLIKEGAKLIESADDITEELGFLVDKHTTNHAGRDEKDGYREIGCDKIEQRLLEVLGNDPLHIDTLVKSSTFSAACVYRKLLELQLKGLVKEIEGKKFAKIR